jgi:hypothetical protein
MCIDIYNRKPDPQFITGEIDSVVYHIKHRHTEYGARIPCMKYTIRTTTSLHDEPVTIQTENDFSEKYSVGQYIKIDLQICDTLGGSRFYCHPNGIELIEKFGFKSQPTDSNIESCNPDIQQPDDLCDNRSDYWSLCSDDAS